MPHAWRRFVLRPQTLPLRRVLFQVHLWIGLVLSLYVLAICLSGGVLVYRSELYARYQPRVDAVGQAVPLPFVITAWLLDLHDNLLAGESGRRWNAVGAALVVLLACTGLVLWWPGVAGWRRALSVDLRASWRRVVWSLHGAAGFWVFGFLLMWGVSGFHLAFPRAFGVVADSLAASDSSPLVQGLGDRVLYWLSYAHFGRFGGRVPGCGPTCGALFKAVWAVVALVPGLLAVTGAIMWWNRTGRSRAPVRRPRPAADAGNVSPA